MDKHGWAVWQGDIKQGSGKISTETGVLRDAPYGYKSRFEDGPGTNPEELIAAAHAACFSMALTLALTRAGFTRQHIETHAKVSLEERGEGYEITRSRLQLRARVPDLDSARFNHIANQVKAECPVSKLLRAEIVLEAELLG